MSLKDSIKRDNTWKRMLRLRMVKNVGESLAHIGNYIERVNYEPFREEMQKKLSPTNWFDVEKTYHKEIVRKSMESGKIKIRVFHWQANMWNTVASLCEALKAEKKIDLLIILVGGPHNLTDTKNQMYQLGFPCVEASEYNLAKDLPDLVVIYHNEGWDAIPDSLKNLRKYTKCIVQLSLAIINPYSSVDKFLGKLQSDKIRPDYCLADRYVYNLAIKYDLSHHNYVEMGSPKLDTIYRIVHGEGACPKEWDKLKGKKVFLFATDHGLSMKKVTQEVAFDIYAGPIFHYFYTHKDVGLIFRPHSTHINDLIKTFWGIGDYNLLKETIVKSPNMVWDETDNYAYAYRIADAVLSDINCDVIGSALVTGKPIAVLRRTDMPVRSYNEFLTKIYCNIQSTDELYRFFDEIRKGEDPGQAKRLALQKKMFLYFDGNNGNRMKDFLLKILGE